MAIKLIKESINVKLQDPGVQKILSNITWLFMDKFLRLGLGLLLVIFLARYLGPEQFGVLNYMQALLALFLVLSGLGMNMILTRDLVIRKEQGRILGTAVVLRMLCSFLLYGVFVATIYWLRDNNEQVKALSWTFGLILIFQSSEIIKLWFESQTSSKYVVAVENFFYIVFLFVKLILIFAKSSLSMIVFVMALEALFVTLGLILIYLKKGGLEERWSFSLKEARYLLKESWPLIVSSAAWVIYTKIDQIMLGQMQGDFAVGVYAAASRLSDVANFFPIIIITSVFPSILIYKKENPSLYIQKVQSLYYFTVTAVIIGSLLITLSSKLIISLIYGDAYTGASSVLNIHFWSIVFSTLSAISGRYMINDGMQKITMTRHLLGVIINIPLNYYLIPIYGVEGAAIATLISLFITSYLFDLFGCYTRHIFIQKSKALYFFWIIDMIRSKSYKDNVK